jgi:S-adenosylmethionine-diacylglycerol 3-amino-3-carboxypropyl transferase
MSIAHPALGPTPQPLNPLERLEQAWFGFLYSRNLVYNTAWEDPAVDRLAMKLQPGDRVLVITSGGCNALDYALEAPQQVVAVDATPARPRCSS